MQAFQKSLAELRNGQPLRVENSISSTTDPKISSVRMRLRTLCERSMRYGQMIALLERIERLQNITVTIESRISERKYKEAHELLQEGLRILKHDDLDEIVALQSIKQYLRTQERALYNIMDFDKQT
ncbi:hypothetical protein V1512DRAFT_250662 [Lipomyces arxii]|uniref:uncharacterized protein n=1 Tax=Lipomyces arxii TaxID=56418 RepID=UPI0034CDF750